MKTSITSLKKIAFTALFLFFAQLSFAANYYAYKNKNVTINGDASFSAHKWILVTMAADGTTEAGSIELPGTTSTLTHSFSDDGLYKIRVQVQNGDGCWSDVDVTKDIDIYVLPDFSVTITPDATTGGTYCENGVDKTVLTAVAPRPAGLPSEVTIDLAVWYKTATAAGDITTGATQVAASGTTYAVTETTPNPYYYVATGKYTVPAGRLISTSNDPVKSNIETVTITQKPTTPTITPTIVP